MATKFMPEIAPDDYQSFRNLPGNDFPDTNDKWLDLTSDKAAELRGKGFTIERIKVKSDEFARYCHATNSAHNLDSLDHFAFEKASGRSY